MYVYKALDGNYVSSCTSVLLFLEVRKLKGREMKRLTQETEDINAKAGTVTLSVDSQPSASFFGCTS